MSNDMSKVATSNATTAATARKPSKVGAAAGLLVGLAALTQFIGAFFAAPLALFLLTSPAALRRRLLLTGVFLTLWFNPSMGEVQYQGSYDPLRGVTVS